MKRRLLFYFLTTGLVMLLLTGIGGCQWLGRDPLSRLGGGNQQTPAASIFVPKQAPVMVSLLVNPDRLKVRRQSRQELNQIKTSLLINTGLDYQRDIQPWLGDEITLAITSKDIDRDAENGQQPGYLMALSTVDPDKSRQFLEGLFSKRAIAGTDLGVEQYKGVKLLYDNFSTQLDNRKPSHDNSQGMLSGAVVGDRFVLFANYPKVLRDAINNVQASELSLSSSSQYQQSLTLLPSRTIGVSFLNLPTLAELLGKQAEAQTDQSQIITFELTSQGLAAETTLLATSATDSNATPVSQPVKALQYIPVGAGLAISGSKLERLSNSDLNQLWTKVSAGISGSGSNASRLVNQPLAALEARWGIDLPQDIFSWVQGEYALGMLPHSNQVAPDWVFVAEKSDAATAGISHLDAIASSQGLSISLLTVGEQKISAWTQLTTAPTSFAEPRVSIALKAKVQGVHTTVGNYEILATSIEALNAALKAPQKQSMLSSLEFKASIDPIPQPNKGYLYLDWMASQETLERQLPILRLLEVVGKPFFSHLRSITISSYGNETGLLKGGVFFKLDDKGVS